MPTQKQFDPETVEWDAIVVGAGMGGGTLGYALARAGRRVLFVERGRSRWPDDNGSLLGRYPEEVWDLAVDSEMVRSDRLLAGGRYPTEVEDITGGRSHTFFPHIGTGAGGSSALYGMVLERLFPSDFTPAKYFPKACNSTLPEAWPISYDDLSPWYAKAERLFRVHGSADVFRPEAGDNLLPPARLTPANEELFAFLIGRGLHPYHLHIGCESVSRCATCQSYLCPRDCKSDAGRICVAPAISRYGASLLSECTVLRLEASPTRVDKVICRWQGRVITLRGKIVALAAGALATPRILLDSTSPQWPMGLANSSGMVGRNLMRHLLDFYLITPKMKGSVEGQVKEIAFNDLYHVHGEKYGTVQSFGPLPPMTYLLNHPGPPPFRRLVRPARRVLALPWERFRHRRLVLASIMEDLPYAENRVMPSCRNGNGRIQFQYTVHEHERRRQRGFRSAIRAMLKPASFMMMKADSNTMLAHVCGTCRFGDDQKTSVLDATNRAHDLSNLYVCDASFFPSSGGINPALTVAANALRVAAHIENQYQY